MEKIRGVALKLQNGKVYELPPPNRHHNVIMMMRDDGVTKLDIAYAEQGFVTDTGRFVDRSEAWTIANSANQVVRDQKNYGDELYSEHLW